jgi:ribosomal protein S18 acetylase RimI-like enzyme
VTFHVGDLHWRLRPRPGCEPETDIRVWEDDRGLLGFAWYEPDGEGDTQSGVRSEAALEHAMLEWMEERARAAGRDFVVVGGFEEDAGRHALLTAHGYVPAGRSYAHMVRTLGVELPDVSLPAGLSLRSLASRDDFLRRDRIQSLAFERTNPYERSWLGLERDALYRMEHDLVVEENGEFLAFATVWPDERNRVGLFEPVGCHPDHRGRGLATAVMIGGLRALSVAGMTRALVYPDCANTAAVALYKSCGFETAAVDCDYRRELSAA